ncbi:MAG: 16S rRNA (cytidine(1402)-2'-O)-methyltransferase [Candidatus Bipolaricaulaceae bacterium]
MPGTLYVCATPIGNLEDITLRAIRVLREVDLIVAEDAARARKLMAHHGIHTPLGPNLAQQVENQRTGAVVDRLARGENVALVAAAGTPLISDPGYPLVRACIQADIPVVPVPGPTAFLAAAVAAGLPLDALLFVGYLPRKAGPRRRRLAELIAVPYTTAVYESPRRLLTTLTELAELCPDRQLVVARELTKAHEEFLRGTAVQLAAEVRRRGGLRGEIVILVAPAPPPQPAPLDPDILRARYQEFLASGRTPRQALRELADELAIPRRRLYQLIHGLARGGP